MSRRLGCGCPCVQCAHGIRLPRPLVARTDAENLYWSLVCLLSRSISRLFPPSRWPRPWPLQGSPSRPEILQASVRCSVWKHCRLVFCNHSDDPKKKMAKPKVTRSKRSFSGCCSYGLETGFASAGPVSCIQRPMRSSCARAWHDAAAAAGTGDGNCLPRHLVEVGFDDVVLRSLWRYLARTPYPTPTFG